MVVSVSVVRCGRVTAGLLASLVRSLQFQRRVHDAVLREFLTHLLFDRCGRCVCHDVHRGVVALTVHTPYVHVMDVCNAVDRAYMLSYIFDGDAVRRFFEENIDGLFEVFHGAEKNEQRHADGH